VYRPACRDEDVSRFFSPPVTSDIGADATAVGTSKARILLEQFLETWIFQPISHVTVNTEIPRLQNMSALGESQNI